MIEFVNGIEIGWVGITEEEAQEQRRLAALPERPLGRATDLRRGKPYGRLLLLYPVVFDKKCATRSLRWLCRCTCLKRIRHAIAPLTKHIMTVRDDFTCALCSRRGKVRFAVHHNIPVEADWARVGDPRNLITLCARCHLRDAHAGRWKTIDLVVQAKLLAISRLREAARPAPEELVQMIQTRLEVLGRKIGRVSFGSGAHLVQ